MLDAKTGKRLWHLNTGDFITASPITYMLDGKQYFAIASGTNIFTFGLPDPAACGGRQTMRASRLHSWSHAASPPRRPKRWSKARRCTTSIHRLSRRQCGAGERAPAIVSDRHQHARGSAATRNSRRSSTMAFPARPCQPGAASCRTATSPIGTYIHALRGTALDNPLPGDAAHGERCSGARANAAVAMPFPVAAARQVPDLANIAAKRKSTAIVDALTKAEHRVYGDGGVHLPVLPTDG